MEPDSSSTFATHSSGVLRGTEGMVEYEIISGSVPFKLMWSVPYFGSATTDWRGPSPLLIEKTEKLGNLTEVHFAITDPLDFLQDKVDSNPARLEKVQSDLSERWKVVLKSAPTSLLISVHNTTPWRFELLQHDIQRGKWTFFPPQVIEPGAKLEFGAESAGNFAGSRGSLTYSVQVHTGNTILTHNLPFSWNWPMIGEPVFKAKIWSLRVAPESGNEKHLTCELALSGEETFVLDTEFAKIDASSSFDERSTQFSNYLEDKIANGEMELRTSTDHRRISGDNRKKSDSLTDWQFEGGSGGDHESDFDESGALLLLGENGNGTDGQVGTGRRRRKFTFSMDDIPEWTPELQRSSQEYPDSLDRLD